MGDVIRPGIVHRLDRETSGVLILAKNQKAHEFLKKQFSASALELKTKSGLADRQNRINKTYIAIVAGWVKNDHGFINKPIGRSPTDFRRRLAGRGEQGKMREAITEYKVIKRFVASAQKFTYLEIKPKTGRTHQIRVHMKFLNHPVACDSLYNPKGACPKGLKRLALHAKSIEFLNLKDKLEKMKVPPPSWCPECRMIRRLACVNGWSLFFRNCDKCGERTLSMYTPSQKITSYCQPCWWGDSWDGTEYAIDYNPSKPFLAQVKELSEKTPYMALETEYLTLKNCDYSNAMSHCKNCTLTIWADFCESVYHSSLLNGVKDVADCLRVFSSELCYESVGQRKSCYRSFYSEECDSCSDMWFSRNCYGCMNCVGCVNLRGASYQIFNKQYSKEEYAEKLKKLRLDTRSGIEALKKEAEIFWKKFPYRFYTGDTFNLNVTGEYVYQSKNSKEMYSSSHSDNCKYCQFITVKPAKDCMDYSGWGNAAELIYESPNIGNNVSNAKFSAYCFPDILNIEYCLWGIALKNCFGCVNLKRKSYSILNKQYSKEEYEKLKAQIIEDMKNNPYVDELGRSWPYGEFPGVLFSKFAYNNSNANKFFPKTREEALSSGYKWNDEVEKQVEATISGSDLPQ